MNILKYLKKTFCGTTQVAVSENGFEEFLRISKGGPTRNSLYDLTNLNLQIAKSWQFSALKCAYDGILKRSGEFYLFRFV